MEFPTRVAQMAGDLLRNRAAAPLVPPAATLVQGLSAARLSDAFLSNMVLDEELVGFRKEAETLLELGH
jgi:hypothetical protein